MRPRAHLPRARAHRLCKDTVQSKKEIKSQEDRIERVKVEEGKDEHEE